MTGVNIITAQHLFHPRLTEQIAKLRVGEQMLQEREFPYVKHSSPDYPDFDVAWQCSGLALQPLLGICAKWHHDHFVNRGHRGSGHGTDLGRLFLSRLFLIPAEPPAAGISLMISVI